MTGPLQPLSVRVRPLLVAVALAAIGAVPALAAQPGAPPAAPGEPPATVSIGTPEQKAQNPKLQERERIGGEAPGKAEPEKKEGMPQLNTRTYPSQIFWLVIGFAVLYYLMRRRALPRVTEILEARQERIAGDLDRAARLREEAEAAQRRHEEVVAQAQHKALDQLRAVQERVAAENAKRQAELEADLNRRLDEAEASINASRERALAEVQNVAADVAQAVVERLAGLQVSEAEVHDALGRVMAEAA
jgi:F-type H+-transporting ATPase subunit b